MASFLHRLRSLSSLPPRKLLYGTAVVLSWLPTYLFLRDHFFQVMSVTGPSMYPFLNPDFHSSTRRNLVLVDMRRPWKDLRRGSVIAFWSPSDPEKLVVKRVVALAGDEVRTKPPYPFARELVPYGHAWVEGENPDGRKSVDSNAYGPIAYGVIAGQLRAVVWPWRQRRWVRWQDWAGSERVTRGKVVVERPQVYVE